VTVFGWWSVDGELTFAERQSRLINNGERGSMEKKQRGISPADYALFKWRRGFPRAMLNQRSRRFQLNAVVTCRERTRPAKASAAKPTISNTHVPGSGTAEMDEMAEELRRVVAEAKTDAPELFRRMVFNTLRSNVDDIPRSHAVIAKDRELICPPTILPLP
jgi:restriction endonuclease Mrr